MAKVVNITIGKPEATRTFNLVYIFLLFVFKKLIKMVFVVVVKIRELFFQYFY